MYFSFSDNVVYFNYITFMANINQNTNKSILVVDDDKDIFQTIKGKKLLEQSKLLKKKCIIEDDKIFKHIFY